MLKISSECERCALPLTSPFFKTQSFAPLQELAIANQRVDDLLATNAELSQLAKVSAKIAEQYATKAREDEVILPQTARSQPLTLILNANLLLHLTMCNVGRLNWRPSAALRISSRSSVMRWARVSGRSLLHNYGASKNTNCHANSCNRVAMSSLIAPTPYNKL